MTNTPSPAPPARKPDLALRPEPPEDMYLRSIAQEDQEFLRGWKNLHRHSFFHQDIITPQLQGRWFAGYGERFDDWMFMVVREGRPAGCLGWRLWQGRADLYNIIRGEEPRRGDGLMSRALRLLLSHLLAEGRADIVARVITGNPALGWYVKNGFVVEREFDDHFLLNLDRAAFTPRSYIIISGD